MLNDRLNERGLQIAKLIQKFAIEDKKTPYASAMDSMVALLSLIVN